MSEQLIKVGKIIGVFGVKGWLKVFSYTQPIENVLSYQDWLLKKGSEQKRISPISGQTHGKGVLVRFGSINDREYAQSLVGYEVFVSREQLKPTVKDEYYWADLVGLQVENLEGIQFGIVDHLFETGANDVLVVKNDRERAIPFLQGPVVKSIDLAGNKMVVDWDADF